MSFDVLFVASKFEVGYRMQYSPITIFRSQGSGYYDRCVGDNLGWVLDIRCGVGTNLPNHLVSLSFWDSLYSKFLF